MTHFFTKEKNLQLHLVNYIIDVSCVKTGIEYFFIFVCGQTTMSEKSHVYSRVLTYLPTNRPTISAGDRTQHYTRDYIFY